MQMNVATQESPAFRQETKRVYDKIVARKNDD